MTRPEIEALLSTVLPQATDAYDPPTPQEWSVLAQRFQTRFPADFVRFVEALTAFEFPGDIFNVSAGARTNGNDRITGAYDSEAKDPAWPVWLIPFYGIGNGDYFALDARAGEDSQVLYWYHERKCAEAYCESFREWLQRLPAFLAT